MTSSYQSTKFSVEKRKRNGMWLHCKTCKKEFYIFPSRLKAKSPPQYCSMKCYKKTGENNPFWGKKHSEISILNMIENPNRVRFKKGVKNPNFIRFGKQSGFIGTTKWWWKKNKKEKSSKCERCSFSDIRILIVHHKDRNINNNKPENIEILCPNCHYLDHYLAKDGNYWKLNH